VATYAVRAGNLIFVQGFTALAEHGHAVGGDDAAARARFALEKIRRCLQAAGATFADVCKVTVFYRNIADREAVNRADREAVNRADREAVNRADREAVNRADREAVNRVRREYFGSTRPASTAIEVSRLVRDDLLVEIEVVAVLPPAP
jgi:2-iminobutanoate/2-iminopropanoate deaminase